MRQIQKALPDNVKSMRLLDVRLEQLGPLYAIVTEKQIDYVSGAAMDRLYVIPMGDKIYKLNTSCRISEAWMFEPIIRHILQSLKINAR